MLIIPVADPQNEIAAGKGWMWTDVLVSSLPKVCPSVTCNILLGWISLHHYVPNWLINYLSSFLLDDTAGSAWDVQWHLESWHYSLWFLLLHGQPCASDRAGVNQSQTNGSISRHPTPTCSRGSYIETFRSRIHLNFWPWRFKCCRPSQNSRTARRWFTFPPTRVESGSSWYCASSCSRQGHWGWTCTTKVVWMTQISPFPLSTSTAPFYFAACSACCRYCLCASFIND